VTRIAPIYLWVGAFIVAVVVALEVFRPLANRVEEGPAMDPSAQRALTAQWTLRETGSWRELEAPDGDVTAVAAKPMRIVSQVLVSDEILHELVAPERVLAHSTISADVRYSNIADIARGYDRLVSTNAEAMLSLRPDLVFVASYSTLETVTQLRRAKVPIIQMTKFDSIDSILENVRVIGFAVGADDKAAALIADVRARLAALVSKSRRSGPAPRLLSWSGGTVPGLNTIFHDVVTRLGAVNIPAEAGHSGWPQVSAEQVGKWDPEWIVLPAAPGQEDRERAGLLADKAIAHTSAVRHGRIIIIPTPHYTSVTHHVLKMVEALSASLYP